MLQEWTDVCGTWIHVINTNNINTFDIRDLLETKNEICVSCWPEDKNNLFSRSRYMLGVIFLGKCRKVFNYDVGSEVDSNGQRYIPQDVLDAIKEFGIIFMPRYEGWLVPRNSRPIGFYFEKEEFPIGSWSAIKQIIIEGRLPCIK